MYCYADHVAYTSARCTGVGWGGVNPMRFKWAYSYMWRHNAKCENMLNLKTLSDTLWRWVKKMLSASCSHYTDSKKKRNFFHFFLDIRMSKMSVSLRRNAHFHITPNENLKNQMFFFSPLMTKINISLRRNTNFHFGVMRLPSKNDHDFEMSFYKVPQIPRFQLLTWKS